MFTIMLKEAKGVVKVMRFGDTQPVRERVKMKGHFVSGLVVVFLTVMQGFLNEKLLGQFQFITRGSAEHHEKWNPEVFRILQFGHIQAAVDWLLIRFLVESGHRKPQKAGERHSSYNDLDLATDLDPAFFELYWAGANYLAVVFSDGASARDLLIKGNRFRKEDLGKYLESFRMRFWGAEWSIPLVLAYVYLFELDHMPEAAKYFQEAAQIKGAPTYLKQLRERFEKPGGEYEVGIRLINFMISGTDSEDARKKLEVKKQSLLVGQFLRHLNNDFFQFSQSQKNNKLQHNFSKFLIGKGLTHFDPWGGEIGIDSTGRIVTTTPHEKVFGLD